MTLLLLIEEIRELGCDWPKSPLTKEHEVVDNQLVDLTRTVAKLHDSLSANQRHLNDAYKFKMQTGADYSDFTDKFDDHARSNHQLKEAVGYIEEIIRAAEG